MTERGPDQTRARDGTEKAERRTVEPAESDADQAVHEKRAENPRGQVRGREPAARTHREDDRHRARGREDERDQAAHEVDAAEVGENPAQAWGQTTVLLFTVHLSIPAARGNRGLSPVLDLARELGGLADIAGRRELEN